MRSLVTALVLLCLLAACSTGSTPGGTPSPASPTPTSPTAPPSTQGTTAPTSPSSGSDEQSDDVPAPGTVPPAWLGTRVLPEGATGLTTPPALRQRRFTLPDSLPMLPGTGFRSKVVDPAPAEVIARSTWNRACPVRAEQLAWVRVTFWGFDDVGHTGELLVNSSVADEVVQVFGDLWKAHFPMEQMAITTVAERDAAPTGDGNDTGAFNCRPVTGGSSYSEHAYGLAIDLNPFQNPYEKGQVVLPELARSYLDRNDVRPGMITADGPVVRAFARIGWGWGGSWRTLKDYQHFSANNR